MGLYACATGVKCLSLYFYYRSTYLFISLKCARIVQAWDFKYLVHGDKTEINLSFSPSHYNYKTIFVLHLRSILTQCESIAQI